MATREQIESYYRFALAKLEKDGPDLSIDDLFESWRIQNPTEAELSESVAAVKAALRDMENGDTGRPLKEVIAEVRAKSKVPHES